MSNTTTPLFVFSRPRRRHARRGQSVVVALLVLLLLGFVGALFITIVARNVFNARHAARVVNADYYAKAGITFADAQLTYGPDGADWRPPLQNTVGIIPTDAREANRYAAAVTTNSLAAAAVTDPDKAYLDQGFTRYTAGAGRFLLRLTYDPINLYKANSAPGRYIKIEAIGREGVIDPLDPTTYGNNRSSDRTQAYQVAYKPIGITDYARFETNLENRSDTANIGVVSQQYVPDPDGHIATPGAIDFIASGSNNYQLYPVVTTYGAADAFLMQTSNNALFPNPTAGTGRPAPLGYTLALGGGSNRANMPVRFFGKNVFYLNDASATAPLFQDTAEIAGNLLLDNYQPAVALDNSGVPAVGQRASLVLNPPASGVAPLGNYIVPSNGPNFDTRGGLIRDGSSQNDANGQPRAIKRLDPPLMDAVDPGSSLPRYKQLALTSSPRLNIASGTCGLPSTYTSYTGTAVAANGYGRSIYINNPNDIQPESSSIGGGTTLTDEWLNTTNAASSGPLGGWNGALYDPAGVNITLGALTANIASCTPSSQRVYGIRMTRINSAWKDPSGAALAGTASDGTSSSTMFVAYTSLEASNNLGTDPGTLSGAAKASYQDNPNNDVLVYAEGNVRVHGVVSPNENPTGTATTTPRHITIVTNGTAYIDGSILKGDPDSSVTILAHDYVCVNTTQFLAGVQSDENAAITPSSAGYPISTGSVLAQDLNFALPDPALISATTQANTYSGTVTALYIAGEPEAGSASSAQVNFNIIDAFGGNVQRSQNFAGLSHKSFDLANFGPARSNALDMHQTDIGQLQVSLDAGADQSTAGANFSLQRAVVLPGDIRIEAVLYAQTRSFFVIPGPSFNSSSDDTLDKFAASGTRDTQTDPRFPLYGQPIDMKIVIDGAVTESRPADINAQTAWMLRWGWIPQFHGSLLTENAGHPNRVGLQMIYNPQAGYPYNPANSYYLRSDQYGRPLPFTPRLPVSTGLLYSGESGEAPILQ